MIRYLVVFRTTSLIVSRSRLWLSHCVPTVLVSSFSVCHCSWLLTLVILSLSSLLFSYTVSQDFPFLSTNFSSLQFCLVYISAYPILLKFTLKITRISTPVSPSPCLSVCIFLFLLSIYLFHTFCPPVSLFIIPLPFLSPLDSPDSFIYYFPPVFQGYIL